MPNPSGADRDADPTRPAAAEAGSAEPQPMDPDDQITDRYVVAPHDAEPVTEVFTSAPDTPAGEPPQRRFTAPGFDAGATEIIPPTHDEAATEVFQTAACASQNKARPQIIPPRLAAKVPAQVQNSWGWVLALTLIILALAAIAVLGTVLLTRDSKPNASQEDQVRGTIEDFDVAVQTGNLTTLRTITCGTTRDGYVNYDDRKWADTYRRVSAAKRYPVVVSIDQVIVNGEHAEANVTTFMAYAPEVRSTRSFDLQFRDDQWKICQAPAG